MSNDRQHSKTRYTKKNVKKIKTWKLLMYFLVFQLLFGIATAPIIVYYSPFFTNLRKNIVGTAMATNSHQFIATLFLSDNKIQSIIKGTDTGGIGSAVVQDLSKINIGGHDNRVEISKVDGGHKFSGFLVTVHDSSRVKVGYTKNIGKSGQKTSDIAKENNALAAINGGGFDDKGSNSTATWTGTGGIPTGIIISDGKLIFPYSGNADTKQTYTGVVGIKKGGVMVVGDYSIDELLNMNVTDALCFGPTLIENSVVKSGISSQGANPRTAIGQKHDGSILLLTLDGRQGLEAGASIEDVQEVMKKAGAVNAVNLDGGASTTMYYNGKVQNTPSDTKFGERPVPTAVYVKK
ncbi:phosphodiester glycosidase family protein [Clostridium akagii]|uniref:phosphodiester glycosidase family protein n=1 Tax=Clostridium akagii TaxID=91623 RepID=UPI00047D502C|nr:phosphodiester glycosidase family protein [Clostridium akagii]